MATKTKATEIESEQAPAEPLAEPAEACPKTPRLRTVRGGVCAATAAKMLGMLNAQGKPNRQLMNYYINQGRLEEIEPGCEGCTSAVVTLASVEKLRGELEGRRRVLKARERYKQEMARRAEESGDGAKGEGVEEEAGPVEGADADADVDVDDDEEDEPLAQPVRRATGASWDEEI